MPKPSKKPRILIVFAHDTGEKSTRFGGFVKRIQANGGFSYADVDYVALEDLVFEIKSETEARVYDPVHNIDFKNYAFVYFKSWQSMPVWAAAAAHYLEAIGIPYADKQVRHGYIEKTVNYMTMWAAGVSVPATIWGSQKSLQYALENDLLGYPVIVKAVFGEKGKDNYLAKTRKEALDILTTTSTEMLLQQFIPNSGDYRIGVYGNKARWAIYRKSGGTSHLNNTSAGGEATNIPIKEIPRKICKLAEAAAAACDLAISGVDVVEDAVTKKLYIFEANQGSQIVTGSFTDTNMAAFDEGMKAMVSSRFKGAVVEARPQVVGRLVQATVKTDDSNMVIRAKVDSGAHRSAINAQRVAMHIDDNGVRYIQYTLVDDTGNRSVTLTSYDFDEAEIRSSTGHIDMRYVVPMTVEIAGKEYNTRVTLANRSGQKNQMLIGRQLLRGNFLINVELGL